MSNQKAVAYHGISNAAYARRTGEGTYSADVLPVPYMKNLAYNPQVQGTDVFADDRRILTVQSDQGIEGNIGASAADHDLEVDLGWKAVSPDGSVMDLDVIENKPVAFYFETNVVLEGGKSEKVKVWLLNVEMGRSSEEFKTRTQTPDFGAYSYSYKAQGETVLTEADGEPYVDENGNTRRSVRIISRPGAASYADFGSAVPTPVWSGGEPGDGEDD